MQEIAEKAIKSVLEKISSKLVLEKLCVITSNELFTDDFRLHKLDIRFTVKFPEEPLWGRLWVYDDGSSTLQFYEDISDLVYERDFITYQNGNYSRNEFTDPFCHDYFDFLNDEPPRPHQTQRGRLLWDCAEEALKEISSEIKLEEVRNVSIDEGEFLVSIKDVKFVMRLEPVLQGGWWVHILDEGRVINSWRRGVVIREGSTGHEPNKVFELLKS